MNGKAKMPPLRKPKPSEIQLHEYRVDMGGQAYLIQTANPLRLDSLSKKGSEAKMSGESLVAFLKSYTVNVLMPGIENFGRIYKVTEREWEGKTIEEKEPVLGGIKQMLELLSTWESVPSLIIQFRGTENVPKSDIVSSNIGFNPFTGKTKKA